MFLAVRRVVFGGCWLELRRDIRWEGGSCVIACFGVDGGVIVVVVITLASVLYYGGVFGSLSTCYFVDGREYGIFIVVAQLAYSSIQNNLPSSSPPIKSTAAVFTEIRNP